MRVDIWGLTRKAVLFEWRLWRSLFRWITRRPVTRDPSAVPFSYAKAVTPALIAFIVVSAIEIPILHLILPWPTVQLISFVLGTQAVLWMVGLLAALRIHPHLVSDTGLHVRNSTSIALTIPWESIASVQTRMRSLPKGRAIQWEGDSDGIGVLHVSVSSQTNIDVVLKQPIEYRGRQASEVRLYADEPREFVLAARAKLPIVVSK